MPDQPPTVPDTIIRAVIAAFPYGKESLGIVYADTRARHAAKVARTMSDIAAVTGEDTLAARLSSSPEVEALFLDGLEAATRTGLEDKRQLLARVVAESVLDEAKVEDAQLLVQALRDLDAPHIRALERIRRAEDGAETPDVSREEGARSDAACAAGQKEPTAVIAALVRTGTVTPASTFFGGGGLISGVTDFGRSLLADLRSVRP